MESDVVDGENKFIWTVKYIVLIAALILLFGSNAYMSVRGLMSFAPLAYQLGFTVGMGFELAKLGFFMHLHSTKLLFNSRILFFIFMALLLTAGTLLKVYCSWSQYYGESTEEIEKIVIDIEQLKEKSNRLKVQMELIKKQLDKDGMPSTYVTARKEARAEYNRLEDDLKKNEGELTILYKNLLEAKNVSGVMVSVAMEAGWNVKYIVISYKVFISILSELSVFALACLVMTMKDPKSVVQKVAQKKGKPIDEAFADGAQKAHHQNYPKKKGDDTHFATEDKKTIHMDSEERNERFKAICDQFGLKAADVKEITQCQKITTTQNWLDGKKNIPDKAFRKLCKWVNTQEHARTRSTGSAVGKNVENSRNRNGDRWLHGGAQETAAIDNILVQAGSSIKHMK